MDNVATLQPTELYGDLRQSNTGFQSNNHQYQSEVAIPSNT